MFSENDNTYKKLFTSFEEKNILIVGDAMIDSYFWGKVDRISPEAPVPVVCIQKTEHRLGGAANVALNIQELGAKPILCAVIGNDKRGDDFIHLLLENKMPTEGMIRSANRPTTNKVRIIGNNVQMLRVDEETNEPITTTEQNKLFTQIKSQIGRAHV